MCISFDCRCSDPAVRHQLVKVLRDLSSWMVDARGNTETHGLSRFRPRGRTSSKGVCEGTVLSCTGGACSRGYKRGERGREASKSLLEEKLIEASANIGAQESVCALVSCAKCGEQPRSDGEDKGRQLLL